MSRVPVRQALLVSTASFSLRLLLWLPPVLLPPPFCAQKMLQLPILGAFVHTTVRQTPLIEMCSAQVFPTHALLPALTAKPFVPRSRLAFLGVDFCRREPLPNLDRHRFIMLAVPSTASTLPPSTSLSSVGFAFAVVLSRRRAWGLATVAVESCGRSSRPRTAPTSSLSAAGAPRQ